MSGSDAMSDDLMDKIFAYVEREAGRAPLLSPEDEAMVRQLLATDPAARGLADDFRDLDARLKGMFLALGNIPMSEEAMTFLHEYTALNEKGLDREAADLLADFERQKRKRRGMTQTPSSKARWP